MTRAHFHSKFFTKKSSTAFNPWQFSFTSSKCGSVCLVMYVVRVCLILFFSFIFSFSLNSLEKGRKIKYKCVCEIVMITRTAT